MNRRLGRHKSVPSSIKRVLTRLQAQPGVKKVILGEHIPCRHKHRDGSLEYRQDTDQGIKVYGYCGDGIRVLFIMLNDVSLRDRVRQGMDI